VAWKEVKYKGECSLIPANFFPRSALSGLSIGNIFLLFCGAIKFTLATTIDELTTRFATGHLGG